MLLLLLLLLLCSNSTWKYQHLEIFRNHLKIHVTSKLQGWSSWTSNWSKFWVRRISSAKKKKKTIYTHNFIVVTNIKMLNSSVPWRQNAKEHILLHFLCPGKLISMTTMVWCFSIPLTSYECLFSSSSCWQNQDVEHHHLCVEGLPFHTHWCHPRWGYHLRRTEQEAQGMEDRNGHRLIMVFTKFQQNHIAVILWSDHVINLQISIVKINVSK